MGGGKGRWGGGGVGGGGGRKQRGYGDRLIELQYNNNNSYKVPISNTSCAVQTT